MAGTRITKRMPSFEGVAASSTATLRLPLGFTYHWLLITSANAVSTWSALRVLINGVTTWRLTGSQLDVVNRFYGDAAAAGDNSLFLHFDRQRVRTRQGEEITAIGTAPYHPEMNPNPVQTLSVEVDLDATLAPALSAIAGLSAATPAGVMRKILPFQYTVGAAGEFQIADLPQRDAILAAHFDGTTPGITQLQVQKNGYDIFNRTAAENTRILGDAEGDRVPITNWFHFDPSEEGHASEMLFAATSDDLRFNLTCSGGGALPVLVEYMGPVVG